MKKLSFFIAICLAATALQAQSVYWSLSGNSATSSNFIGTTNSNTLNFKTNGALRMTLSASQAFLGIGTSTPDSDLKSYVQKYRHLPGIPSAAEVEENGVELGATTEQLLQKIEEMTLYILQLEERFQKLENEKGGAR